MIKSLQALIARPADALSLLSIIIAFGTLATTQAYHADLTTLLGPTLAPKILAAVDLLAGLAGIIATALRLQSNPSPPPGYSSVVTASAQPTVTVEPIATAGVTTVPPKT